MDVGNPGVSEPVYLLDEVAHVVFASTKIENVLLGVLTESFDDEENSPTIQYLKDLSKNKPNTLFIPGSIPRHNFHEHSKI